MIKNASIATHLGTMSKIAFNSIEGTLGIKGQVEGEMQVEKETNKKALAEANYNNTPKTKQIKKY